MPSVLAIVSKAQFEAAAKGLGLGDAMQLDRYASTGKGLDPLADGGALFLVTVRSGDVLWLVGILESPTKRKDGWFAAPSTVAITDVTELKDRLRFSSGNGITAKPGALGMSLQTPRELTEADVVLLRSAVGSARPPAPPPAPAPAPASLAALLTEARDLASRDPKGALDRLLRAYRLVPADAIADAIVAVSARAQDGLSLPTGKTAKERNQGWIDAAKGGDPAMRGLLAATLAETKGSGETLERIEALVPHLPDPRVSARIADLVEVPAYNASVSRTLPFWKRVFALLPELGDPRVMARASRWPELWKGNSELNEAERPELEKRLNKILPTLRDRFVTSTALDANEASIVGEIASRLSPADRTKARTEESLLAEVYADPAADGPRLVYADWLQERNDPRGELIALQFARRDGTLSREGARREKDLLAEQQPRLLGSLAKKAQKGSVHFERGFLDSAIAASGVDDDPAWATLTAIARGFPHHDGHMPLLRSITDVGSAAIRHLATLTQPLPVEELQWNGPNYYNRVWQEEMAGTIEAFGKLRVLPSLKRLTIGDGSWCGIFFRGQTRLDSITPEQLAWLFRSPAMTHLEELRLTAHPRTLPAFLDAWTPTPVQRIGFAWWQSDWKSAPVHAICAREGGKVSRLDLSVQEIHQNQMDALLDELDAMPTDLFTHIRVRITQTQWLGGDTSKRFGAWLDRQTRAKEKSTDLVARVATP
ncbi:MAG: TIGR02996 domain-containing protein [Polyangiales bacterium]